MNDDDVMLEALSFVLKTQCTPNPNRECDFWGLVRKSLAEEPAVVPLPSSLPHIGKTDE